MSRFSVKLQENREFIYGFDHVLGYFYEIWDYNVSKNQEECLIEDKCHLFHKLSKVDMVGTMSKFGANPRHVELVALDMPF